MPRRANQAIKKYHDQNDKVRYKFHVYVGTDKVTGKRKNLTRSGFKTYSEADQEFRRLKTQGVGENFENVTLNRLRDLWWQSYYPTVRASTAKKFEEFYRINVQDTLGQLKIREIQPVQWQQFADKMARKYVNYKVGLNNLKRIYRYAISLKLTDTNPLDRIIIPKRTSKPKRDVSHNFYDEKELKEFLLTAQDVSNEVYLYFYLLAGSGLRKSEALALHWSDIDFKASQVKVHRTLTLDLKNHVVEQNTTKSKAGMRIVPIPKKLLTELMKYKLQNGQYQHIFSTRYDTPLTISKPQQWLNLVYKRNDSLRHITIHGFRHTYASIVFASNPDIKPTDMRDLLGHETVEMSMDIYTHVTSKSKDRIARTINSLDI